MKTNAIIRVVIWCLVIVVLVCLLLSGLGFTRYAFSNYAVKNESSLVVVEETMAAAGVLESEAKITLSPDQVTDLEIEWAAGSILIQPADVAEIQITESDVANEKDALRWKVSGGKLTILFSEDDVIHFGISSTLSKDLRILVPLGWQCDSLEIDAASATLEVNNLTIREVEIDTASGACRFDSCIVDQLDLDTASGDVEFVGDLNILDCDAASANIRAVLGNVPNRMDLDTMSGDLDLTLPEDAGFTVVMDGLGSSFSSDFETTTQNGHHVHGSGACRINVDAMSGSVIIRKAPAAIQHAHTDECTSNPSSCPDNMEETHHDEEERH